MYKIHESYLVSISRFSLHTKCRLTRTKWKLTRTKCMLTHMKYMPTRTKAKPTRTKAKPTSNKAKLTCTSQLSIRCQHERIRKQLNLNSSLVQSLRGPSVNYAYCNRPIARYRVPKHAIGR